MLFKYVQVQLDICRALPQIEALKHIAGYESSGIGTAKVPCNANKLSHVGGNGCHLLKLINKEHADVQLGRICF